jgi:hypothetical protein
MEGKRQHREYALMNACAIREALGTTWALSETGKGPTGNRYMTTMVMRFAVSGPVEKTCTLETGDPDRGQHVAIR